MQNLHNIQSSSSAQNNIIKGVDPEGRLGQSTPKAYESNFIHHNFVQLGKQHWRFKAIFPSIVSSQQCCEVNFVFLTMVNL